MYVAIARLEPLTDPAAAIQQYLKSLNGQGTVPHVYIKQHVSTLRPAEAGSTASGGLLAAWAEAANRLLLQRVLPIYTCLAASR